MAHRQGTGLSYTRAKRKPKPRKVIKRRRKLKTFSRGGG